MDACTNPEILKVIYFIQLLIDIVKIAIPIGLIVMGMIDFSKSVITNDDKIQKKNLMLFLKRVMYAALVFVVPWIVEVLMIGIGNLTEKVNFTDCLENAKYINHYENLANQEETLDVSTQIKDLNEANQTETFLIKDGEIDKAETDGIFIGNKYNLTESQLKAIAYICQCEQGSAKGAAAEASLMANRFELYGKSYGTGADGLYNYVKNAGWWAYSKDRMDNPGKTYDYILTAVYEVLVLGKRTLPLYVDEHDCIDCGSYGFDIIKIVNGNQVITEESELLNRNNYIRDYTVLYNDYNGIYTFYTFPTETSDPFGYTKGAKNKYDSLNN